MDFTIDNIPLLFVLAFLSIVFIQSGLDKIINWKGNLEFHFGDPFKINTVRHHRAVPYKILPAFYKLLVKN